MYVCVLTRVAQIITATSKVVALSKLKTNVLHLQFTVFDNMRSQYFFYIYHSLLSN